MNKSDQWKAKQVFQTFGLFRDQFENYDDHSRVVLEVIFEALHGKKRKGLSILSEKGQIRSEASDYIPTDGEDDFTVEGE
jgi:hypothetical protein